MSEEKAAEKIQASFRGYKTRKSLKNNGVLPAKPDVKEGKHKEEIEEKIEELPEHPEKKTSKPSAQKEAAPDETVDIDLSDKDLEKAATKIQASYRNFTARKKQEQDVTEAVENSPKQEKKEAVTGREETEDKEPEKTQSGENKEQDENLEDIDLGDPNVEKAALKIQSTFRGFKVRKELNTEEQTEENEEKVVNEESG
ncbi:histone-lysine N-methyltransferase set-26-like [Stegodyphus dumicola]|uniref:histone-lysine N-methyltransferase set-26-like n=1 Tax=Stegodyphus dumicola TaxID=202533 RepID=UPI0015B1EC1D|nr:histone-lysine N-methyltransferase set-26-like [Stegodyphus dumicola]